MCNVAVLVVTVAPFSAQRRSIIVGDILLPLLIGSSHTKLQIMNQKKLFLRNSILTRTPIADGKNLDQTITYRARYFIFMILVVAGLDIH